MPIKRFGNTGWLKWLPVFALMMALLAGCADQGSGEPITLPDSDLLARMERKSGLIAYIGVDGNVYTINQGGGNQHALTSDAVIPEADTGDLQVYQTPLWSPDGQQVAFIGLTADDAGITQTSILVADANGKNAVSVYSSQSEFPVFLGWAPDGSSVSFITQSQLRNSFLFQHVDAKGEGEAQILDVGAPLFWDWGAAGNMLLNADGAVQNGPAPRLSILDPANAEVEDRLEIQPAYFSAPAWSPDEARMLAAVRATEGDVQLVIANHWGEIEETISTLSGEAAFDWSPDGQMIAYVASDTFTADGIVGPLTVVDANDPATIISATDAPVIAFFWSPNSKQIAYFAAVQILPDPESEAAEDAPPPEDQPLRLALFLLDLKSGESRQMAIFRPTELFTNTLRFFDQYQRAATIWSPDSQNVVISGFSSEGTPGIWVVPTSGRIGPRFITPGLMAFWSWK